MGQDGQDGLSSLSYSFGGPSCGLHTYFTPVLLLFYPLFLRTAIAENGVIAFT